MKTNMPTKVDTRWAKFQTERKSVENIMDAYKFNEDFQFGITTSSTQIEGTDPNNTWYQWCRDRKKPDQCVCLHACDHWNRVRQDIELLKDLHIQSYRMSLEWGRIEPVQGEFSDKAIRHYREEIRF
jgi:beta-glucosidase